MRVTRDIEEMKLEYLGKRINSLTIIDIFKSTIEQDPKGHMHTMAACQCDCGNTVIYPLGRILSCKYKSCGCSHLEASLRTIKRAQEARTAIQMLNRYCILNPYTVEVYTIGKYGSKFWVDPYTWLWMKRFTWNINSHGYPVTQIGGFGFTYHQTILCSPPGYEIDHITTVKADTRYFNLRVLTHKENMWNYEARENTKSGIRGVYQRDGKWIAYLVTQNGDKLEQQCESREDAIRLRKNWESIYHVVHPIETPHLFLQDGSLNPYFRFDWYPDRFFIMWEALGLQVVPMPIVNPAKKSVHINASFL